MIVNIQDCGYTLYLTRGGGVIQDMQVFRNRTLAVDYLMNAMAIDGLLPSKVRKIHFNSDSSQPVLYAQYYGNELLLTKWMNQFVSTKIQTIESFNYLLQPILPFDDDDDGGFEYTDAQLELKMRYQLAIELHEVGLETQLKLQTKARQIKKEHRSFIKQEPKHL